MTEDMRERFEKWTIDYHGSMPNSPFMARLDNNQYVQEVLQHQWEAWQAALSSAGTSGTADTEELTERLEKLLVACIRLAIIRWELKDDEGENLTDEIAAEIAQETAWACQGEGTCADEPIKEWSEVVTLVRGDSLSGKGETMNKTHTPDCDRSVPSAPDRAEELADEILDLAYDSLESHAVRKRAVASLLRREMGRWIPVSERLPDTNEAGVSSVFFWVTSEDGWQFGYYRKDAEGECWESERSDAYNEPYTYSTEQVSYWLPESALPAPPREEV